MSAYMSVNPWVLLVMAGMFFVAALGAAVWICIELTVDDRNERTPH